MSLPRVRRETLRTSGPGCRFRILFASDLHLGLPWTRRAAQQLTALAEQESPDIVLLGGDLVDNGRGLDAIEACLRELATRRPVAAIPGNHDFATGVEAVRRRVLRAGASWLTDEPLVMRASSGLDLRFCGNVNDVPAPGHLNVACLHDPNDVGAASRAGFALAFAGHLHGGQCVLFEYRGRLYPGAWFNRWTGLRFDVGDLRLFVSLGFADTLPLRLNCPREVIVCDITGGQLAI